MGRKNPKAIPKTGLAELQGTHRRAKLCGHI